MLAGHSRLSVDDGAVPTTQTLGNRRQSVPWGLAPTSPIQSPLRLSRTDSARFSPNPKHKVFQDLRLLSLLLFQLLSGSSEPGNNGADANAVPVTNHTVLKNRWGAIWSKATGLRSSFLGWFGFFCFGVCFFLNFW